MTFKILKRLSLLSLSILTYQTNCMDSDALNPSTTVAAEEMHAKEEAAKRARILALRAERKAEKAARKKVDAVLSSTGKMSPADAELAALYGIPASIQNHASGHTGKHARPGGQKSGFRHSFIPKGRRK